MQGGIKAEEYESAGCHASSIAEVNTTPLTISSRESVEVDPVSSEISLSRKIILFVNVAFKAEYVCCRDVRAFFTFRVRVASMTLGHPES